MAKQISKRAKLRKKLSKPASKLTASQLDTRRELIAEGRAKTSPGPKRKTKKAGGGKLGKTIRTIKSRGRL